MKDKLMNLLAPVFIRLNKGQERSINIKKNILASIFIRGLSIGISLLLVPLTINFISPSGYGVWLTISSIIAWFSFFDIGLTQGLRNKFAEAKAKGNHDLAQIYVSTTYGMLAIIFVTLWLIFLILNQYLNWANILNVSQDMRSEVSILAIIVFTYFCFQFVLKVITTVVIADQQPAKASLIDLLGQALSLILISILVVTTKGSLVKLGIALCFSPLLVLAGANLFFFRGVYKKYRPKLSKIYFSYAKDIFNLGIIFFVIQVAGVIQYQTANFIIAQSFGAVEVTNYNIAYKYFGIIGMIFIIFITPFWSASTEAYLKKDIDWIKNAIRKYRRLCILMTSIGIIMLMFSNKVFNLWLGKGTVNISYNLSFWALIYFIVTMAAGIYVYFLNGINALRIQFIASLISPFLFLGMAYLLIEYYHLGVSSLFIASIVSNFNGFILAPLQYHMIINKNKKGIWVK